MLDPAYVQGSLKSLCAANAHVFGANGHCWLLNATLPESEVLAFENEHGIRLPDDYRQFITKIGNGGAGPFYGIFPLGWMDAVSQPLKKWSENDGFIGRLSQNFPLAETWNDLQGHPSPELLDTDDEEYEKQLNIFDQGYFASSHVNGAIPICHEGCALRIWLIVTGAQAGRLWRDARADYTGISPLSLTDGFPATFGIWYSQWLREALLQAGLG